MKAASPSLISYLNSGRQFLKADLYTVTISSGTVLRYTSADVTLIYGGNVFSKAMIERGQTRNSVGLETDTLDITFIESLNDTIQGVPWLQAARTGALDGATVKVERLFMPSLYDTSLGSIFMFQGRIAEMEINRTSVKCTLKSDLQLLDVQVPKDLFESGCGRTLYDAGCGLSKATFAVSGTVTAGSSLTQVHSALGQAADYFSLGTIVFVTGANVGSILNVRSFSGGNFTMSVPLLNVPAVGDAFTAYPGCDKSQATCQNKFSNLNNFIGFPYVPDPEVGI